MKNKLTRAARSALRTTFEVIAIAAPLVPLFFLIDAIWRPGGLI